MPPLNQPDPSTIPVPRDEPINRQEADNEVAVAPVVPTTQEQAPFTPQGAEPTPDVQSRLDSIRQTVERDFPALRPPSTEQFSPETTTQETDRLLRQLGINQVSQPIAPDLSEEYAELAKQQGITNFQGQVAGINDNIRRLEHQRNVLQQAYQDQPHLSSTLRGRIDAVERNYNQRINQQVIEGQYAQDQLEFRNSYINTLLAYKQQSFENAQRAFEFTTGVQLQTRSMVFQELQQNYENARKDYEFEFNRKIKEIELRTGFLLQELEITQRAKESARIDGEMMVKALAGQYLANGVRGVEGISQAHREALTKLGRKYSPDNPGLFVEALAGILAQGGGEAVDVKIQTTASGYNIIKIDKDGNVTTTAVTDPLKLEQAETETALAWARINSQKKYYESQITLLQQELGIPPGSVTTTTDPLGQNTQNLPINAQNLEKDFKVVFDTSLTKYLNDDEIGNIVRTFTTQQQGTTDPDFVRFFSEDYTGQVYQATGALTREFREYLEGNINNQQILNYATQQAIKAKYADEIKDIRNLFSTNVLINPDQALLHRLGITPEIARQREGLLNQLFDVEDMVGNIFAEYLATTNKTPESLINDSDLLTAVEMAGLQLERDIENNTLFSIFEPDVIFKRLHQGEVTRPTTPLIRELEEAGGVQEPTPSPVQVGGDYRSVVEKYFPSDVTDTILELIQLESAGDPNAERDTRGQNVPRGHQQEYSIGLFQINQPVHAQRISRLSGIPVSNQQGQVEWLKNPDNNARIAAELYDEQGLAPWKLSSQKLGR